MNKDCFTLFIKKTVVTPSSFDASFDNLLLYPFQYFYPLLKHTKIKPYLA